MKGLVLLWTAGIGGLAPRFIALHPQGFIHDLPDMKNTPHMKSVLSLVALPFLFVSCAQQSLTGDAYSRNETGQAQAVKHGRITSIRYVQIEGGTAAGTVLGGVAGGVLGNQIGGGTGRTLATIGGAGLGAVAGSHAQKAIDSRQGLEIQVRLDGGGSIAVTQEANPREPFSQGDRVRVLTNGGRTRITH